MRRKRTNSFLRRRDRCHRVALRHHLRDAQALADRQSRGRWGPAGPRAACACRRRCAPVGLEHHVVYTESLDHARAAGAAAAADGRGRGGVRRRRADRRGRRRAQAHRRGGRDAPGRARQRSVAGCSASRASRSRRARCLRRAWFASSTSVRPATARSPASPAAGSTPSSTRSPTRRESYVAVSCTRTGCCEPCHRWKPAGFEVGLDGGEPRTFAGYSVAAANSKAYGGGMLLAPNASLTDGLIDVVIIERHAEAPFPAPAPDRVQRAARPPARASTWSARGRCGSAPTRPFTMYADGEPIAELPVTVRVLPGAVRMIVPRHDAARRKDRCGPRGRRARPPCRARRRDEPARQGADARSSRARSRELSARLPRGSRRDLGDQRQDDDRRDGRVRARARRHPGSSTTEPGRTWPAASRRRCSPPRAAAGGSTGSSGCSRSTSSGSTGSRRSCEPRGDAARQPVPRPARPLRRARDDRRPLGRGGVVGSLPEPRARLVLNADDPLIADLGRERAERDLLRRRGPVDGDARDAARVGLQALPALRRRVRVRGDLPRPPRALPLPLVRAAAPGAGRRGRADRARRHARGRASR